MFLDTTAAAAEGESVTTEPSQEPPGSNRHPTPKGPTTHELDETRFQDVP